MKKNSHILNLFFSLFISILISSCEQKPYIKKRMASVSKKGNVLDSFFENFDTEKASELPIIKSKKPIRIAAVIPVTGAYRKIGKEMTDTLHLIYAQNITHNLLIDIFDTRSSKSSIPILYEEMKKLDYDVIIGPVFNYETLQFPVTQNIPIISLSNDKSIHRPEILMFGYRQEDAITDIISFFSAHEKKNFMGIFPSNSHGTRFYKSFKEGIAQTGGNMMRTEFYEDNSTPHEIQKYVNKIIYGNTQTTYTSVETGEKIPERKMREILKNNPTLDITTLFEVEQNMVDVIYISAEGENLVNILSILSDPIHQKKLENVAIIVSSPLETSEIVNQFDNIFFYSNDYIGYKAFAYDFYEKNGYAPTKLGSILYDAVLYTVFVNNKTYGKLRAQDLKTKYRGFYGLNNAFTVKDDIIKRYGKLMLIKDGKVEEISSLPLHQISFENQNVIENQKHMMPVENILEN